MQSQQTFVIRRAEAADTERLAELAARTFRDAYAGATDPVELESHIAANLGLASIAAELADPAAATLLLEVDGEPAGYALLRTGPVPECVRGPAPIELGRIYLAAERIGRGHGAALMRACLEAARGMGRKTLWLAVWHENHRALRFYEAWGFQRVGSYAFNFGGTLYQDVAMARSLQDAP
jgi:diamine N-acetyltransferase